jgi:hypothetical protein
MTFNDILDKHMDHEVVIIPRKFRHKATPTAGLYCAKCVKLIKWLSDRDWQELRSAGVEELPMLKNEKIYTAKELGI